MSALYTPKANKQLGSAEDKWKWLEDLEELCWTNKNVRKSDDNNPQVSRQLESTDSGSSPDLGVDAYGW